jgi:hypothetical protein
MITNQVPQVMEHSDQLSVVATDQGIMWQICSGGQCIRAHSGRRLLELYRELRNARGLPVPPAL